MSGHISDAVIRRLPGYYRQLRLLEKEGIERISSQELARQMNLTASQIRQDINCFGGFGQQGYGYRVQELKEHIGAIMGLDERHRMILIGAGNIGHAVANYPTFQAEGFVTVGVFDVRPEAIGRNVAGCVVRGMDGLEEFIAENDVTLAVLAVPGDAAQAVCDRVTSAGVRGVWNFAPVNLSVPDGVSAVTVHLTDSLQILSYRMKHSGDK